MNCRADRVDRTEQFARDVLPRLDIGTLVLIGEATDPITKEFAAGKISAESLLDFEGRETEEVLRAIEDKFSGRVIFGVGNIHGAAASLLEEIRTYKMKQIVS